MASSVGGTGHRAAASNQKRGPEDTFDEFVALMHRIPLERSYQALKTMFDDNESFQRRLDETKIAYEKNLAVLAEFSVSRKAEKEALEKEIRGQKEHRQKLLEEKGAADKKLADEGKKTAALFDKLKAGEEAVKTLIKTSKGHEKRAGDLEGEKKELERQLQAVKKENERLGKELQSTKGQLNTETTALQEAHGKLAAINTFIEPLTPLTEETKASVSGMLGSSFNDVSEVLRNFLGCDLDENQLQNIWAWDPIRNHPSIQRAIPLPLSNSPAAKKMRVAAGMAIYSGALGRHLFRMAYLSVGDGVDRALAALPATDPTQDRLVRGVLLRALPGQQQHCRDACVDHVVKEVLAALAPWLPDDGQLARFESELADLTVAMCRRWQHVQRLTERVEPFFDFEDVNDWQRLPPLSLEDKISPAGGGKHQSGGQPKRNNSNNNNNNNGGGASGRQALPKLQDPELKLKDLELKDLVKVVWPAFLSLGTPDEGDELVRHGYALTRADVETASGEDTADKSRRAARRNTRDRDGGPPVTPGGQARNSPRRDSGVGFLSPTCSDGSDTK